MPSKSKDHDKRILRVVSILNKLNADGKVHSRELSEEFCVSIRSIQRDLELLNMAGFPLVSLEKGIWMFIEGFSLRKAMLTKEEASLLVFLYDIAKSLGKNFEDSFNDILKKVISKDCESVFYAKIPEGVRIDQNMPFVKDLEHAIEETKRVSFYYLKDGKEKWLKVDPLKIVFFDGFWYLASRVSSKDWILKLRLENIKKLEVLDEYFKIPKNLKTMLDESVNVWFSEKRDKKVTVSVGREAARFFKQKAYFPLQKIIKENKDGSLVIEFKACQYEEIIHIIMHWIPHITVVHPQELKNEIRSLIKKYSSSL